MIEKIKNFLLQLSRQQKILFGFAVFLVLVLVAQTWFISYNKEKLGSGTQNTTSNQPSALSPTSTQPNLFIISTVPSDEKTSVSLSEKITITFNRKITVSEIDFTLLPSLPVTTEINENIITVTPKDPYEPGMKYTFVIRFPNSTLLTRSYSFTTIGPTQPFLPDTQPTGAAEKEDNFQKENHPDVFLSNQTPFENEMFSIESDFKSTPTGHFYFKIMLKGNYETSKKAVFDWMKSLGLLDTQIQKLDIEYISK